MSEHFSKNQPQTSGLAVGSLVCGVLFTGLPAIVLGHIALRKIARSSGSLRGRGLALTGMILGYLTPSHPGEGSRARREGSPKPVLVH